MAAPSSRPLAQVATEEKEKAVCRARAQGMTWEQCAEFAGYTDASSARKAFLRAMRKDKSGDVEIIREESGAQLEYALSKLMPLIADPPAQHSAIGKVVKDDDGNVVRNESVRIQAATSLTRIVKQKCELFGVNLIPLDPATVPGYNDVVAYLQETITRNQELEGTVNALRAENGRLKAGLPAIASGSEW